MVVHLHQSNQERAISLGQQCFGLIACLKSVVIGLVDQ
jgi:hypothetical protein